MDMADYHLRCKKCGAGFIEMIELCAHECDPDQAHQRPPRRRPGRRNSGNIKAGQRPEIEA